MAHITDHKSVGSISEFFRFGATRKLDKNTRSRLGQYMTPAPIGRFMASMFEELGGSLRVLDPGAGVGSLTAAVVDQILDLDERPESVSLFAYEIDHNLIEYLRATMQEAVAACAQAGIRASNETCRDDFIQIFSEHLRPNLFSDIDDREATFSHVIMNPPYGKIRSGSVIDNALRQAQIEVPNLYAAFILIAAILLQEHGEMVAIVPRSFCNGPYFSAFRKRFFEMMVIKRIHVFNQRDSAFGDDDVLQENVIVHAAKASTGTTVEMTSSDNGRFFYDPKSGSWVTEDMTQLTVDHSEVVEPDDPDLMVRIHASGFDRIVIEQLERFPASIEDIGVEVSTGPVVDFRLRSELRSEPNLGSAPLLYPAHFSNGDLEWPKNSKKPNAININENSRRWLWQNRGCFVVTKRFTSKEELRRVVAFVYDSELPGDLVGFENHLNIYHSRQRGLSKPLAAGLSCYLNSGLVDGYFRVFSGHTQVNATDLRAIPYPTRETLESIGRKSSDSKLTQGEIDQIIGEVIPGMQDQPNPVAAQEKIEQAVEILKVLGLPREVTNSRSALTLLALVDLKPVGAWHDLRRPLMGITPIMDFCREFYERDYAPNTRETFRRNTMHQFVEAGIALYNPDDPDRAVNSPLACYQISEDVAELLSTFGTDSWEARVEDYKQHHDSLTEIWLQERRTRMVPVQLDPGTTINLTPGDHSELINSVIAEFAPRFVPGAEVVYVGDTGDKTAYLMSDILEELGVAVNLRGKMPDTILYYRERNWLMLIEAVTSHGPVNPKRYTELAEIFDVSSAGVVYVTAFPSRSVMARFLDDISWETEVWCADAPSHLIHFDGDSFLGPFRD